MAMLAVFFGSLLTRIPLKMDVIRDRGSMAREVENGMIENVYRLQIMNTDEIAHRYRIVVSGIDSITLASPSEVKLQDTESRSVPVTVRIAYGKGVPGSNRIMFELKAVDDASVRVKEKASFFVPR